MVRIHLVLMSLSYVLLYTSHIQNMPDIREGDFMQPIRVITVGGRKAVILEIINHASVML